ncbi:MAG: phosphatidate cytidylyltransferase [Paracoccaceae bacterium]|nr:phosphatidate cytidylyltransferase [Paracoccaceae bacterium]
MSAQRWADLKARSLSAVVMIAVGAVAIWAGGGLFTALVMALTGAMLWELNAINGPGRAGLGLMLAASGAAALLICLMAGPGLAVALLFLPALGLGVLARRDRGLTVAWAAAAMIAGYGLVLLRHGLGDGAGGIPAILWLVLVVVVSDLMGYFAGRMLGGAKFWPAISPKKTWSGTVAGWIGAALVGLGFVLAGQAGWGLVALSPLVGFAGQMGDICESWLKRRAGVKDSSALIPGHGGVLDRFDAMTGAVVVLMLLGLLVDLPLPIAAAG